MLEEKTASLIINGMKNDVKLKNRFKRPLLWAGLWAILLLTGFSIYGAFIGADRAQNFFNSIPLSVYWVGFTALLIGAIALFGRLMRLRGLLMIHLGCIMVLIGALWGSQAGFKIQDALLHTDTVRTGQMVIYEGMTNNTVDVDMKLGLTKPLPFAVRLADFRLEYYEPGTLMIQTPQNQTPTVAAEIGAKYSLSGDWDSVEIVRKFEHFKLVIQDNKQAAIDDPQSSPNPALELRLTRPDGSQTIRYVFERFGGHIRPEDNIHFRYFRMVRDFISDLEVIKDGTVLTRKSIEVNKPLHFDGYIFYQQGYDDLEGQFTVLRVANDRGLWLVFTGYVLLCAGAFWHLWFRHLGHSKGRAD